MWLDWMMLMSFR